jgi:hypothetical protein
MTLVVFFGVATGLLVLRMLPAVILRTVSPVRRRYARLLPAWLARARRSAFDACRPSQPLTAARRIKLLLVSSMLLMLALVATTEYWSTHASLLMSLLR